MGPIENRRLLVVVLGVLAAAALLASSALAGFGPKLKPKMKSKRAIATQQFDISGSDNPQRFEVFCPHGKRPLGGGAFSSPVPDADDGGGAYPTAYERLGQQEGWHVTISQ